MTERAGDPGEREREEEEQEDEDGVVGWQCVCHVRARTTIRQILISIAPYPLPFPSIHLLPLGSACMRMGLVTENGSSYISQPHIH